MPQTLKDVSRERFDVNGVPTEPCDCWHEIRALLLKPLGAAEATKGGGGARAARAKASGGGPSAGGANPSQPRPQSAACADAAAGDKASGRGCWERGGSWKSGLPTDGYNASKTPAERYVDQCSWRVLHAASRTASGGDCFFVVQVRHAAAAAATASVDDKLVSTPRHVTVCVHMQLLQRLAVPFFFRAHTYDKTVFSEVSL